MLGLYILLHLKIDNIVKLVVQHRGAISTLLLFSTTSICLYIYIYIYIYKAHLIIRSERSMVTVCARVHDKHEILAPYAIRTNFLYGKEKPLLKMKYIYIYIYT